MPLFRNTGERVEFFKDVKHALKLALDEHRSEAQHSQQQPNPARNDAKAKVLRDVEWGGYTSTGLTECPACRGLKRHGHKPDCQLDAVLRSDVQPVKELSSFPIETAKAVNFIFGKPEEDKQPAAPSQAARALESVRDGLRIAHKDAVDKGMSIEYTAGITHGINDLTIAIEALRSEPVEPETCRWTQRDFMVEPRYNIQRFDTQCGTHYGAAIGTYCPNCGKPIELSRGEG
jgi:hypothetical protein